MFNNQFIYAYTYGSERECHFDIQMFKDYEIAIKDHPDSFSLLKKRLDKKHHKVDALNDIFMNHLRLDEQIIKILNTGDVVYPSQFKGKDKLGDELCELLESYCDYQFVYLFKEFANHLSLNFKACHSDDLHEYQSKLIDFLSVE